MKPAREPVAKFICPSCGELTVSRVVNTIPVEPRRRGRQPPRPTGVKRWRECNECGERFPTFEGVVEPDRAQRHRPQLRRPRLPFPRESSQG